MRVNYDELTVTCNGFPSEESLLNLYSLLIDIFTLKYGKDIVRIALEELINEQ